VFAARFAHDAGLVVTELYTSWLTTPAEEAVIEARVEARHDEGRSEQVNDEVNKIIDALRSNGYEPSLRIEDITTHEGGPLTAWTPDEDNRPKEAWLCQSDLAPPTALFWPHPGIGDLARVGDSSTLIWPHPGGRGCRLAADCRCRWRGW